MTWPNGKRFAFTIIDDTDKSTVENIKPVYDYLYSHGLKTTKTVPGTAFPDRRSPIRNTKTLYFL